MSMIKESRDFSIDTHILIPIGHQLEGPRMDISPAQVCLLKADFSPTAQLARRTHCHMM